MRDVYRRSTSTYRGKSYERPLSLSAASDRGLPGLIDDAEREGEVILEPHRRAVAAIISIDRLIELRSIRSDLSAAAHVIARELTDDGGRTDLDGAITLFGYARAELETNSIRTSPSAACRSTATDNPGRAVTSMSGSWSVRYI